MKAKINKVIIEIQQGDIYAVDVEGLVHSTTPNLPIPPALGEPAGESLEEETKLIGWCDIGAAVVTNAGNMHFKKIIHTVGPKWGEVSARGKLAKATWESLWSAEDEKLKSVTLPAISTGVAGYPVENCARTMLEQIIDFTFEPVKSVRHIIVCVETEPEFDAFQTEFQRQLQSLKDNGEGKVYV